MKKMPPVESGAVCSLDDILEKAGNQLVTLIHDIDRFTATELVADERIDKWGMPSRPEKRKFTYMVTIEEPRPGQLSVDEYRNVVNSPEEFPNGVMDERIAGHGPDFSSVLRWQLHDGLRGIGANRWRPCVAGTLQAAARQANCHSGLSSRSPRHHPSGCIARQSLDFFG